MRSAIYGPFVPGESPFRVKGHVYKALFESFDLRVPGGASAVVARLDDADVRAFFERPFLGASTYDILPLIEASMMSARLAGHGWREFVRGGAAWKAERDLHGVYRVMLKVASAKLVVERLPRMLIQYFDFGSVEGAFASDTRYEAEVRGIPKPVWPWLSAIAEGFIPVVLQSTGVGDASVVVLPPSLDETRHEMPMLTGRFTVTWL